MATSMTVSLAMPIGSEVGLAALLGNSGPTLTASFNFLVDTDDEAEDYGRTASSFFTAFVRGYTGVDIT